MHVLATMIVIMIMICLIQELLQSALLSDMKAVSSGGVCG